MTAPRPDLVVVEELRDWLRNMASVFENAKAVFVDESDRLSNDHHRLLVWADAIDALLARCAEMEGERARRNPEFISYAADGTLDDINIYDVEQFRMENMNEATYWIRLYRRGGKDIVFWIGGNPVNGTHSDEYEDGAGPFDVLVNGQSSLDAAAPQPPKGNGDE